MVSIVFIQNSLDIGGIERSLINLLNYIDYSRLNVDLILLSTTDTLLDEVNPHVQVCFQVNAMERLLNAWARNGHNFSRHSRDFILRAWRKICTILKRTALFRDRLSGPPVRKAYDAAFSLNQHLAQNYTLEKIEAKEKYAFYQHGNHEVFDKYYDSFKRFDGIVVVSNILRELICNKHPDLSDKLYMMHSIVPYDAIISYSNEQINDITPFEGGYVLLSCGRLNNDKGFDILIQAAELLKHKYSILFRLYIVGDGKEKRNLETQIREARLENEVILLGWRRNPYSYMQKCHLYIQPSRVESFGISIVEAQILGRAIVSTRTLGAREVIEDGNTGVLCEPTAPSLAAKIALLLSDNRLRSRIEDGVRQIDFYGRNQKAIDQFYNLATPLS